MSFPRSSGRAVAGALLASGAAVAASLLVWKRLRDRRRPTRGKTEFLLDPEKRPLLPAGPLIRKERWADVPDWVVRAEDRGPGKLYPPLEFDELFLDNTDPCLFTVLPPSGRPAGHGAAVVVPGGNYEFLGNHEAFSIAEWLAQDLGITAYVLKYRLLPHSTLQDRHEDFRRAVAYARKMMRVAQGGTRSDAGPVFAIGFSAGSHLIASACAEGGDLWATRPEAMGLIYPSVDPSEWADKEKGGYWHDLDMKSKEVTSLQAHKEKILPGPAFVAPPPTFIASCIVDDICPPKEHGDPFAAAAEAAGVSVMHLRGDFGGHGFGLQDYWTTPCNHFLRSLGFGRDV
eukprot:TRINITY_DN71215_c0_g1_i1.p1 TRINITY_DN71215_c0_g1~~TRINITY_DN71215_c0_g1_i1.p1  ORF type:complete len:361 (+),score=56.80 TRINITY_DN71215_c0_g1_i1:54-1085(+)